MATQKYKNNAASTLNGAITAVATTCTVVAAGSFPTSGDFMIIIEGEIIKVTAVAGNVFTIVRAQEGTGAAPHASASAVTHILTAGAWDALRAETIQQGPLASLPAAERAGRIYRTTDSVYDFIDTGSAWQAYLRGPKMTPPTGLSWVNQGTATLSTANGGEFIRIVASDNGIRSRMMAVPAAPFTKTVCIIPLIPPGHLMPPNAATFPLCGLTVTDGTKFITFAVQWRADGPAGSDNVRGMFMSIAQWTTYLVFLDTPPGFGNKYIKPAAYGYPIWLRYNDDNTNRKYSFSLDGFEFITIYTEPRTTHLTATQIGYFANSTSCTNEMGVRAVSWE